MLEEALKSTLSGIKVMSSIKDISTTMDIVDSMATICKMSADSVQEVFRLIDKIETLEFISLLQEKTSESINILDDYKESLKRMNNYINQDIMGILIISE
jgi:CTP-dependent riboflavin kinase